MNEDQGSILFCRVSFLLTTGRSLLKKEKKKKSGSNDILKISEFLIMDLEIFNLLF